MIVNLRLNYIEEYIDNFKIIIKNKNLIEKNKYIFKYLYYQIIKTKSNFVLSVDSLTIKIELLIRTFIEINGGNITTYNTQEKETRIQLLDELIRNDIFIKKFKTEDIYFLNIY
jgi:hypothetical protein